MARAQKMMSSTAKEKMVAMPVARQMIMDRMPSLERSGQLGILHVD